MRMTRIVLALSCACDPVHTPGSVDAAPAVDAGIDAAPDAWAADAADPVAPEMSCVIDALFFTPSSLRARVELDCGQPDSVIVTIRVQSTDLTRSLLVTQTGVQCPGVAFADFSESFALRFPEAIAVSQSPPHDPARCVEMALDKARQ